MVAKFVTLAALLVGCVYSQTPAPSAASCCGASLMDSDSRALVETKSLLPVDGFPFKSVKVRVCTSDPLFIQLWRPASGNPTDSIEWILDWQIYYDPTVNETTTINGWTFLYAQTNRLAIQPYHRLGLHTIATHPNARGKFPVPYEFKSAYAQIGLIISQEHADIFNTGDTYAFDELMWPRSFVPNVRFCIDPNCPQYAADDPAGGGNGGGTVITGPKGEQGETGPPGPPGMFCDDPGYISGKLTELDIQTQSVNEKVDAIDSALKALTSSNQVTGTCPAGFTPGTYGVGSCYMFVRNPSYNFGNAQLFCHDNYRAHLVSIISEQEERYLRETILREMRQTENVQMEEFWTSGMLSSAINRWVWYDEWTSDRSIMSYTHWADGEPKKFLSMNNCMAYRVDREGNDAWYASDCPERKSFICKVQKQCL